MVVLRTHRLSGRKWNGGEILRSVRSVRSKLFENNGLVESPFAVGVRSRLAFCVRGTRDEGS